MRNELIVKYLDFLITLEDLNQILKTLQDMKKYIEESYDEKYEKVIFFFFKSEHEIIY